MQAISGAVDGKFIVKIIGGPLAHTRFSSGARNNTLGSSLYCNLQDYICPSDILILLPHNPLSILCYMNIYLVPNTYNIL